ncbi:putative hydro-lyase [Pseudaminobacter arsenicus]|uniref:Putative hydro-lyase EET67_03325 n=1 Tax=Borborobacter arsenicus TaxID=1851146 RepID=A0A432VAJ7_9HYPH|nr:putative hydro-lyase [Pseudaminobacter arsenicus]RUM99212.1 putative hydro-lyase [Pseudaminobacter arsenicus]
MTVLTKVPEAAQVTKADLEGLSPKEIRSIVREGRWTGGTEGLARGYAQANLIILPQEVALEFLIFCQRNPKPCPIVEVTDPGSPMVTQVANADLRTDLPRYSVYKDGKLIDQPSNIVKYWRDDLVGFLIGCSYSFEEALLGAGIPLRHQEEDKIVSVYTTDVPCVPAGRFAGPMVVSMRPIKNHQLVRAIQVTSRFPATHGAPVHVGDPSLIGVDLNKTDFDTGVFELGEDDVPVFWGCGGTPQAVALASKIDFMITHKVGHLFITDKRSEAIAAL